MRNEGTYECNLNVIESQRIQASKVYSAGGVG